MRKKAFLFLIWCFAFLHLPSFPTSSGKKQQYAGKTLRKKKKEIQEKKPTPPPEVPVGDVEVILQTFMGEIRLDLYKSKEEKTVENFLKYAKSGFYNNTIFHRIIDGFILQGGAYSPDFEYKKPLYPPLHNYHHNGLRNIAGTIAMARKVKEPNSATSQFFINLADNHFLDEGDGYTVFGCVLEGMEVIRKIAKIKVGQREGLHHVPFYPREAEIFSVKIIDKS